MERDRISELEAELARVRAEKEQLEHQVAQLQRLMYGAKRERFVPVADNQLPLPFGAEKAPLPPPAEQISTYERRKANRRGHPGRNAFPAHLPVEETVIEPEVATADMPRIGELITEELEYVPARLYIRRYVRPKYSLGKEKGVAVAELPERPIDRCIAGPGLLAQSVVDKFCDHLPIYRQLDRFKRENIKIAASTVDGWQEGTYRLLYPLYATMSAQVLAEGYLQVDETPIKVLEKGKGKAVQGYHWAYHSPIRRAVIFDYRKGRSREGPEELLSGFRGYLQTDGYGGYDRLRQKKDIVPLSCMAHVRRYFEQALGNDRERASHALSEIQKLYATERKAREKGMSPTERHALRLEEALEVLNGLGKWLAQEYRKTLPKSPIGKAMAYAIARWDHILNYLNDGRLEIDNNLVENKIRPIAIGRKNYLFAGSHHGAERAAMFYSLIGTCKQNDIEPYAWLKYVIANIKKHKVNRLQELLPYNIDTELLR